MEPAADWQAAQPDGRLLLGIPVCLRFEVVGSLYGGDVGEFRAFPNLVKLCVGVTLA